jgi:hypothetical protein
MPDTRWCIKQSSSSAMSLATQSRIRLAAMSGSLKRRLREASAEKAQAQHEGSEAASAKPGPSACA